jgi:alanine or glycine:cation symporter, AGCS family
VVEHSFGGDKLIVGIIIAFLAGLVILGGIKRIGKVAEKLVPLMAVIYTVAALIIIITNIVDVPAALATIVKTAFTGMGTSPVAHATATTDHPVRQGI